MAPPDDGTDYADHDSYDSRADYRDLASLSSYKKSLLQASYLTHAGLIVDFLLR